MLVLREHPNMTRWSLIKVFLAMGYGGHTTKAFPDVEYYKVNAFELEPEAGVYDVSGETAPLVCGEPK